VLLSPYLGPPELSEKIRALGGLENWTPENPGNAESSEESIEENWSFLKQVSSTGGRSPALHLGYGRKEEMTPSLDLLADSLPPSHVARIPGGHRWKTWQALWTELLPRQIFDNPKAGTMALPTLFGAQPVPRGRRLRWTDCLSSQR
jgi:hypothetical protein